MSKHPDAVGYLRDIENEVNQPWFNLICDESITNPNFSVDPKGIETLKALYVGIASYVPPKTKSIPPAQPTAATQFAFLEQISDFLNFKRLQDTFTLKFEKQVTLVFGHNGSGKSSVCDALKILANHETPTRPIHNVRGMGTQKVGFSYKLRGATTNKWQETVGFGFEHSRIKYFDSSVATRSIKENIEPGSIVELSPFNMNVFDKAKTNTGKLKESFQHIQNDLALKLDEEIKRVKCLFLSFPGTELSRLEITTLDKVANEINTIVGYTEDQNLDEMKLRFKDLEKISSAEGQKLLASEIRDLTTTINQIKTVRQLFEDFKTTNLAQLIQELESKINEQRLLNEGFVPKKGTLEDFIEFLKAGHKVCSFEEQNEQACPLCGRKNEKEQIELFKKYFDLLDGQIEKDIKSLRDKIKTAEAHLNSLKSIDSKTIDAAENIEVPVKVEIKYLFDNLKNSVDEQFNIDKSSQEYLHALDKINLKCEILLKEKTATVETAKKGLSEIEKEKALVAKEITRVEYLTVAKANIEALRGVISISKKKAFWDASIPKFTPLLKKLTDAEKAAHEDLIVSDFHKRLEAEYKQIAEKDMAAFGVILNKRGSASGVSVTAKIGGKEISSILSEGEQRLHSLALFFAELETSKHSIIIFDDPISSFDYDYIANYCFRLRDFISKHPNKQVVVFTHNWEFFVNLQLVLNKHHLSPKLDVQVMESCSVVSTYSEKIDDLKANIGSILSAPNEPSKHQKEVMAGQMRRLIESVVNTHVFNNERHQFKHKGQSVSEFHKFTKVKPLLPQEATDLKDLFGKLSITEHDDPRTAFVNTDKAMFQTRFDKILAIEQAILLRQ